MTGPSGKSLGLVQANPKIQARSSRLSSLGRPLRAASLRAASRPAEEKRLIILLTTGRVTFSSSLIWVLILPSAAKNHLSPLVGSEFLFAGRKNFTQSFSCPSRLGTYFRLLPAINKLHIYDQL